MTENEIIVSKFKKSVEDYRKKLASGREAHPEKFIQYLASEIQTLNNLKNAYQDGMNLIIADMKKLGTGK
ncbi:MULTISPECIES: hypothetical protein [Bacillus]|uniref:hypothetical protein n=1 Tax=Bacillus TaxID=1386 RepID=UPI001BD04AE9|nr:hypothetical protein [Bacillus altitudinis]MBS4747454.1 hypothetical protein [Bacillus altitudinis]